MKTKRLGQIFVNDALIILDEAEQSFEGIVFPHERKETSTATEKTENKSSVEGK